MSQEFHDALIRSKRQSWIFILCFTLLLGGFVASLLLAWSDGAMTRSTQNGWKDFAHGAPMRALAEDLRQTPLANWLGRKQRELGWLALDDLGPRVSAGCPGWLFLNDELTVHPDGAHQAEARARIVQEIHHDLRTRGSQLLVVLVPDKSRVEAAHGCALPRSPRLEARYEDWKNRLDAAGIPWVDLLPVLTQVHQNTGAAFDRSDTHWNIDGARAAADATARELKNLGFAPATPIHFKIDIGTPQARWGDLVRLAGLEQLPESWRPAPDTVPPVNITSQAPDAAELGADALFGDSQDSRVTLAGTSFSRNAHFADFLAAALNAEVGNLARDGGGFARSMRDVLEQEQRASQPTPWVIWEIPERMLQEPLTAEEESLRRLLKTGATAPVPTM